MIHFTSVFPTSVGGRGTSSPPGGGFGGAADCNPSLPDRFFAFHHESSPAGGLPLSPLPRAVSISKRRVKTYTCSRGEHDRDIFVSTVFYVVVCCVISLMSYAAPNAFREFVRGIVPQPNSDQIWNTTGTIYRAHREKEKLKHLVTIGQIEGERSRGSQRMNITDSLSTWYGMRAT